LTLKDTYEFGKFWIKVVFVKVDIPIDGDFVIDMVVAHIGLTLFVIARDTLFCEDISNGFRIKFLLIGIRNVTVNYTSNDFEVTKVWFNACEVFFTSF